MSHTYPSPITTVSVTHKGQTVTLQTPEKEVFLVREIFEGHEYALLPYRTHTGRRRVLDVGANVGLFAVYMKLKYPHCVIHCYEPSAATLELCRTNTCPFGDDIALHEYGLYNQDTRATLYLSPHNTGQNSIHTPTDATAPVELRDAGGEWDRLGWDHLDVLKVDTEGCEVEILTSLGPRLSAIDYILVEHHADADRRQIDALLTDFQLYAARLYAPGQGTAAYVHHRLLTITPS